MLRWRRVLLVLTLLLCTSAVLAAPTALAQDAGIPPFPVLVTGSVTVDDEVPLDETMLTARIGDWESRPVAVVNGRFGDVPGLPLIVGPPSDAYVGQQVTFHLDGELVAIQGFIFQRTGEPTGVDVQLQFATGQEPGNTDPGLVTPAGTPTPATGSGGPGEAGADDANDGGSNATWVILGLSALAVVGGAVWVRRRR